MMSVWMFDWGCDLMWGRVVIIRLLVWTYTWIYRMTSTLPLPVRKTGLYAPPPMLAV